VAEALRCEQHAPGAALHLKAGCDGDGRPVEVLHVHGYVPAGRSRAAQRVLWAALGEHGDVPPVLGRVGPHARSEPLAITQLVLLHHLAQLAR
jgi:phosphoribulokinase